VPDAAPAMTPGPSCEPAVPNPVPDPAELRARIRGLERSRAPRPAAVMPLGVEALDRCLAGGGLALGRVHEVIGEARSEIRNAAAFGFAAALVSRLMQAEGDVLWCPRGANPHGGMPSARGLAQLGLDPGRIILAETRGDTDRLWAMEEGLGCAGLIAVVAELEAPRSGARTRDSVSCRRLQLAAEASGVTGILLRADAGMAMAASGTPDTRWRVTSVPWTAGDVRGNMPVVDDWRPRWHVDLLRARNGRVGEATLAWDPARGLFHRLDPSASREKRPVPPPRPQPDSVRSVA
jgi:protein ImuA